MSFVKTDMRAVELAMGLLDRVVHNTALLPGSEMKWAFLIQQEFDRVISDYRIAALQSVMHDEQFHEIVKSALDKADKAVRG